MEGIPVRPEHVAVILLNVFKKLIQFWKHLQWQCYENNILLGIMSWNSVAGMVIRLQAGQLWKVVQFVVDTRDIFLLQRVHTYWLTQPPVQWVLEALSTGIKPPRHEVYYHPTYCRGLQWVKKHIHSPYAFMAFTETTLLHLCFCTSETSFEEEDPCGEYDKGTT